MRKRLSGYKDPIPFIHFQDLAVKTLRELLFGEFKSESEDSGWRSMSLTVKNIVEERVSIIADAVDISGSTFADFIKSSLDEEQENPLARKAAKALSSSRVCQVMIDCLVELMLSYDHQSGKVFLSAL